jgi:hypothetical protein
LQQGISTSYKGEHRTAAIPCDKPATKVPPRVAFWERFPDSSPGSLSRKRWLTPVTRAIDRMDDPSQSIERIWTRFSVGNLFMPHNMNFYA